MSGGIQSLLSASLDEGHNHDPIVSGWSKVDTVYYMDGPMSDALHRLASDLAGIEYFYTEGDPHNRRAEGYIDRAQNAAISFPTSRTGPRA
jgi:hypothetical protein